MLKIKDILHFVEEIAPLSYQEEYDNAGLIIGNKDQDLSGILICLDSIEEVIEEAINFKCNLIISHHPIIFKGLKKITGNNYIENVVITAIKHDIAIYALHTNLDNIDQGVNKKICEKLNLKDTKILLPKKGNLRKLVTFIPHEHTRDVLNAIHAAGAGIIGDYDHCSFRVGGTGSFRPNEMAKPHIGEKDKLEEVDEERMEVIFPDYKTNDVLHALRSSHPYEEVAYYLQDLENEDKEVGTGMIGEFEEGMNTEDFLHFLKENMQLPMIKYAPSKKSIIKRIALCGGSGSFLIPTAIAAGADAFITADIKYHNYFDGNGKILIADIGHYESEVFTKELIYELLNKKFSNIALRLSEVNTNPVRYI